MRISIGIISFVLLGLGPAAALESAVPSLAAPAPIECARASDALVPALQSAADVGDLPAQSTLGCMYARGEGVPRRDAKAFEYFRRIANEHAEDAPDLPQARLVASAFVALGQFYLHGIADAHLAANPGRARDLFAYAAAYFGDADAQYYLARLCLSGPGMAREPLLAARWLRLAANKGQHRAQAELGFMLFNGGEVPRQAAPGLMWLTLARDAAGPDDAWISEAYEAAFSAANETDRAAALQLLELHLRGRTY
jgi:TPR repeat protein